MVVDGRCGDSGTRLGGHVCGCWFGVADLWIADLKRSAGNVPWHLGLFCRGWADYSSIHSETRYDLLLAVNRGKSLQLKHYHFSK